MTRIYKNGAVEIWQWAADEFAVYGIYHSGDPRVCPSAAMAREVAASGETK